MPILIALIILVCLGTFAFIKLRRSKMVANLAKELFDEPIPKPNEVIRDIGAAEKSLEATAKAKAKEAEKLQKDSAKIGEYLADHGVVKPQGKEADGNEVVDGG
jgi:hypothetical protein